jgi:assimilatory nitrate reductase catalytic subunit
VRAGAQGGTERLFGDGAFATSTGRARIVTIEPGRLAAATTETWPFVLNTGRVRDQWHTMTRTGLSPRLATHVAEPFVEIHPDDAGVLGLEQGGLARVATRHGAALLRVMLSQGQQPGSLFVPIHWSAANSSDGRIGALVQPITDPLSGQPESKATPAALSRVEASHYGFLLSRNAVTPDAQYWTRARMPAGFATFLALTATPASWSAWSGPLLPAGEPLTYEDARSRQFRVAVVRGQRLEAVLYMAAGPTLPSLEWLKGCFDRPVTSAAERRSLLAGRPVGGADEGPIVCACFQVGRGRIEAAVAGGACSADEIGAATRAGTNCGSCVPELKRMAAAARIVLPAAAE